MSNSDDENTIHVNHPSSRIELGRRLSAVLSLVESRQKAADIAERSTDILAKYVKGWVEPPFVPLARLCAAAGVRMEWLATGEGPQLVEQLLRVADEGASYDASQDMRLRALRLAIEMIDDALKNARKELSTPQRAEAYALLADLIMDEEDLPNAKVVQLAIKSVAQG
jgi:hypothetical protein